jgi:hypothetical protein
MGLPHRGWRSPHRPGQNRDRATRRCSPPYRDVGALNECAANAINYARAVYEMLTKLASRELAVTNCYFRTWRPAILSPAFISLTSFCPTSPGRLFAQFHVVDQETISACELFRLFSPKRQRWGLYFCFLLSALTVDLISTVGRNQENP